MKCILPYSEQSILAVLLYFLIHPVLQPEREKLYRFQSLEFPNLVLLSIDEEGL